MNEKITYNWRYISIAVVFTLFGLAIIAQMARIQLTVNSSELPVPVLLGQWEKAASRRGLILDRNGHVLAGNQTVYAVDVNFEDFNQPGEIEEVKMLADLAIEAFDIKNQYLLEFLQQEPRPLERNLTVENFATQADLLHFLDLLERYYAGLPLEEKTEESEESEGTAPLSIEESIELIDCDHLVRVSCSPHLIRSYPEGRMASNIIGFVMRDSNEGQLGIEEKFDSTLFGNDRTWWAFWDPHKADLAPDPDHGANIVLTIDSVLQADVETILDESIKKTGALAGTVIVMDPRNGEILAMASSPRADINRYWDEEYFEIINNLENVFNYAIKSYEPGSVVKVLTMAAALDAGVVEPDTEFIDEGQIEIGGVTIKNWNEKAWGPQDMTSCLQNSLNVCLAWVATQLESESFYNYFQDFGFGQMTGIELAGEAPGLVKSYRSPDYTRSELGTNAFGQGIEITPIQMVKAVSAIANGGEMVAPRIIHSVVDDGYRYTPPKTVVGHPVSAETAETLTEMLRQSLKNESSLALVPGYSLAGKTGTAEIYIPSLGYKSSATNTSFVGWGPTDDPQFIVYVWISKPSASIWGSEIAAPVFRKVVEKLVIHQGIPPDAVRIALQE
ncbi:MAG TPA: penicillin-binding protein 2 [Chloroflexi bacterium]|nr:penicillin-binding protein 2 [Chloroflexota bacterium]